MKRDIFPTTATWIDREIDRGRPGLDQVNRHLMEVYREPLEVYFRRMPQARYLDASDVVAGFFADRLSRPDYLAKWQETDKLLREWLRWGLRYYVYEQRPPKEHGLGDAEPPAGPDDAGDAEEQAFAKATCRQAMLEGQRSCEGRYAKHWDMFVRHYVHDQPHARLALEFGVDERRAAVMVRTAKNRFVAAVLDILRRDGVPESDIEAAIRSLLGKI